MANTTVHVVHRLTLPVDQFGEIFTRFADVPGDSPYPPGASVVVDVGEGRWMYRSEVQRLAYALSHCAHVTVMGDTIEPPKNFADHVAVGVEAIGRLLDDLLRNPPLFPIQRAAV